MKHTTVFLATLLSLPACDSGEKAPTEGTAQKENAKKDEAAKDAPAKADAKDAPTMKDEGAKVDARTVASGLDVGQRFKAFDIFNCDSGEKYCQVCRFGGSPKIMAVGTLDDEAFRKDLQDIDAIVKKYGDDKVKAFAVIADAKDGALMTPGDVDARQAAAKKLKTELGIDLPVVVPAPEADGPNGVFEDHYKVTKSRTLMFADARNTVKYSQVAPENLGELDKAIAEVVGG